MAMKETTTNAVKCWAFLNSIHVFDTVLHLGVDFERLRWASEWTISALVDNEGFDPEKARQIMDKVQAVSIRKAVKRLDEIGQGAYDEELKCWRDF